MSRWTKSPRFKQHRARRRNAPLNARIRPYSWKRIVSASNRVSAEFRKLSEAMSKMVKSQMLCVTHESLYSDAFFDQPAIREAAKKMGEDLLNRREQRVLLSIKGDDQRPALTTSAITLNEVHVQVKQFREHQRALHDKLRESLNVPRSIFIYEQVQGAGEVSR